MRIAFLNPWRNAAENQAFRSLRESAARIGHDLVHCSNSDEVEVYQPDFVLGIASTQPKLNDVPHYGVIHEPRDRFLKSREYFTNLLTYDGYLTISDSLNRFLRDVLYGVGRRDEIGYYYNTCQRQQRTTDVGALLRDRALVVTYFGTNWDHRRTGFFRLLSDCDNVQICGPKHSWPDINPKSYGGTPAFDGDSVQARYADNGIGLCLLSDAHLRDDIVSNRIFEITSVGAIAICCDVPWIRRHFGDSVYYIDQELPDAALVRAVEQRVRDIYADPDAAVARAARARQIFEQHFAAEILIANTVDYHRRVRTAREEALTRAKHAYEPLISVVIRCGGRPVSVVRGALQSLMAQTYGHFEVVFVRYDDLDLTPLLAERAPNIRSMKVVDCPGGGRSATLWAGLSALSGEYFAVLDDDDWLFSNHFERLFQPFPTGPAQRFLAYCGSISEHVLPKPIFGGGEDRRELFKFGIESSAEMFHVSAAFASNSFVASADLLHRELLEDPGMSTAEDSFLILMLLAQAEPRFSYSATSAHTRGARDQSNFLQDPQRFEDELTLQTRMFGRFRPRFANPDGWAQLERAWSRRPSPKPSRVDDASAEAPAAVPDPAPSPEVIESSERIAHVLSGRWPMLVDVDPRGCVGAGFRTEGARVSRSSQVEDAASGSAFVQCPEAPLAFGVALPLSAAPRVKGDHVVIAEIVVDQGEVGVGVLNAAEDAFAFHWHLKADPRVQEVHVPVDDFTDVGPFVIQNGRTHGLSIARLESVRVFGPV